MDNDDLIFGDEGFPEEKPKPKEKPPEVIELTELDEKQTSPMIFSSNLEARLADCNIELDQGQRESLSIYRGKMNAATHMSTVMTCAADCPVLSICPLKNAGVSLPLGKLCPVEQSIMDDCVQTYCAALNIDPATSMGSLELAMVWELARNEIIEFRANASLAKNPKVVRRELTNVTPDGTSIFTDEIAPEITILERWSKAKVKLRQELLATRRSQAMAGQAQDDHTAKMAKLKKRADKLLSAGKDRKGTHLEIDDGS